MQKDTRSAPDERLTQAFASWSNARGELRHLRARLASVLAQDQGRGSEEAASLADAVQRQRSACARLWWEFANTKKEIASPPDATWTVSAEESPVNILIVDDEKGNLTALEAVLADPRYRLVRAASGEEALLALLADEFACLLLDVRMPGMTGFELARIIGTRRKCARTPIIFLTAHYQDDEDALEGYATGAVDYLHKPFRPEVLRRKVEVFAALHRMVRQEQAPNAGLGPSGVAGAAEESARRRLDFVASASRELSRSQDLAQVVATVLQLCVPGLGQGAVLALAEGNADVHRLEFHWSPGTDEADAFSKELRVQIRHAAHDKAFRWWRSGDLAAAICPLMVGDEARGVLGTFGRAASLDGAQVELVRDLASRAAIAIENARLNAAVRDAEQRKQNLLAMLAHELRNPLAPISNAVQIIRRRPAPPAALDWACDVISRHASQMAHLIDGLLDVARATHGKLDLRQETVALATVVERAVEASASHAELRKQAITVDLPAQAMVIDGDPVRLTQALSNLIHNASKFSGRESTIRVVATPGDGEARISVKDEGSGIAAEFLPRVFDLFEQGEQALDRPYGGLGVGLTLVRQIVELHGGRVVAFSPGPGEGTEVTIHLPARPVHGEHVEQTSTAPHGYGAASREATASVRILVVDDEVASAETLAALLQLKGFEVCIAHDGVGALDAAEAFLPDVVLLDIGLPGMNGFEVAQRLRMRAREVLLIALTGYGDPESRAMSAQGGFDSHMTKPADVDQLMGMLADPHATKRGSG